MPTFKTAQPRSIATSITALMKSSPNLSEVDRARALGINAASDQHTAMAEKARLEAESIRRRHELQDNPEAALDLGSIASGMTVPQARQFEGYRRGEPIPPATAVDDEGNVNSPAEYARPDITPEAERSFRSAIGAILASQYATGPTNAEQFTHAGSRLFEQATKQAMQRQDITVPDQNTLAASIGGRAREPYPGTPNSQGLYINQESGVPEVADEGIRDAAVKAIEALGTKREADAARPPGPRGGGAVETEAQKREREARASRNETAAETQRLELDRQKQSQLKSQFRNDRQWKGKDVALGNWVKFKKDGKEQAGFELVDKSGKLLGYYH